MCKCSYCDDGYNEPRNKPPHDKTNNMAVRPAETQISVGIRPVWSESSRRLRSAWAFAQSDLGIRPVWSESSLSAWRRLGSLDTHWAHSADSDQTGRMPRLIWVFAGRTCHFVGFFTRRFKKPCIDQALKTIWRIVEGSFSCQNSRL